MICGCKEWRFVLLKIVQMVITGWKDGQYRKKKFANCTGQGTTLVYAHSHINYLLFRQRLSTKTRVGSNKYVLRLHTRTVLVS